MDRETERLKTLIYYVNGRIRGSNHSISVLTELMNLGYLSCGITSDLEETYRTTDHGLIYLDLFGIPVPLPTVEGGRIVNHS